MVALDDVYATKVSYAWEDRQAWLELPFPLAEYERRVQAVQAGIRKRGLAALLVYNAPGRTGEIRYLTNFNSFFGISVLIVPPEGELTIVSNACFHGEPMHTEVWKTWVRDFRHAHFSIPVAKPGSVADLLIEALRQRKLEGARLGLAGYAWWPMVLNQRLSEALPAFRVEPADDLILEVKKIKSPLEVEVMRRLAWIGDRGLEAGFRAVRPGVSELDVCAEVHHALIKSGAEEVGGEIVVVGGPRAGFKHVWPTSRKFQEGDMVFIDLKAVYQGYWCDIARSFAVGTPSPQARKLLDLCVRLSEETLSRVKPGVALGSLYEIPQSLADAAGIGQRFFPTGLGHGTGTSRAEPPFLHVGSTVPFEENMVFSLEPALAVEGLGTACIEDMCRVTADGAERMSRFDRVLW